MDDIVNKTNIDYRNKSYEIVPLSDVNNLSNLYKHVENYINNTIKVKEQNLLMTSIIQQLELIQKQINFNNEKETFYQLQLKKLDLEIQQTDLYFNLNNKLKDGELEKAKKPSLIQKLIDAKIIGNNKTNNDSVQIDITEETNDKTLTGTKKVITTAKITTNANSNPNPDNKCVNCGHSIYITSVRCGKCENMRRLSESITNNKNRPSLIQLQEDLKTLKSYVQVGKKYGVSDNCIRKWINKYKKFNESTNQTSC